MSGRGKNRAKANRPMPSWVEGDRFPGEQCVELWVTCSGCGRLLVWFERSTRPEDDQHNPDDLHGDGLTYRRDHSRFAPLDDEWTAFHVRCDRCDPHNRVIFRLEINQLIAQKWAPDGRHARVTLPV